MTLVRPDGITLNHQPEHDLVEIGIDFIEVRFQIGPERVLRRKRAVKLFRLALHYRYRTFQIRLQDRAVKWRDRRKVRPP